ncbi:MAG: hypothetical protein ACE5HU_03400 [Acidobacteriota bacterium]
MEPIPGSASSASPPQRRWTIRDIPLAVQVAFDTQKLTVGAAGLMAACIAYGMFSWLGDRTGEKAAHRVFTVLGAILATCICVLFSGLVARMTTVQLLENRRVGAAEMRQFTRERWVTLMGIPLTFGGITILLLTAEAMISMVGAIPGVGPIIFSASFLLIFLMSLVIVVIAAVHMVGAFLYPTIVAIRGTGAVGAMVEIVKLARNEPLLLLLYELIVAAVGTLMAFILGLVVWASVSLSTAAAGAIMGDRLDRIFAAIPSFFRIFLHPLRGMLPLSSTGAAVAWHYDLAGTLLGSSLLVLFVLTLAYPFVFFTSAGSITYLILRPEPVEREPSPIEDL